MAKLLTLDVAGVTSKKAAKSKLKTVPVAGDVVTRYNEARDQMDKAEEVINELKPTLIEAGLEAVFNHNHEHAGDSKSMVSSVNLSDAKSGEACMFSWTRKNSANDPKQVEAEFKLLRMVDGKKADINQFCGFELVPKFDGGVFMEDGKFSKSRYEAFVKAIKAVADLFQIESPLSFEQKLAPKPEFHDKRFEVFDVEANLAIQTVLPTQCNLKPVRDKE